jgi:hypothetical protein
MGQVPFDSVSPGEYVCPALHNGDGRIYNISGTAQLVSGPVGVRWVSGGTHNVAYRDSLFHPWTYGDQNLYGQAGIGTLSASSYGATEILTDSAGNPFTNIYKCWASGTAWGWNCFFLKLDSSLWITGQYFGRQATKPILVRFQSGVKIVDVKVGLTITALDQNGNVWVIGGGNQGFDTPYVNPQGTSTPDTTDPIQISLPGPAIKIWGSSFWSGALMADSTTAYAWGPWPGFLSIGNPADSNSQHGPLSMSPQRVDTGWNLPTKIVDIQVNNTGTYIILSNGTLWYCGDAAQGNGGEGSHVNMATYPNGTSTNPYAWNQSENPAQLLIRHFKQIGIGIHWLRLFSTNALCYEVYAQDINGNLYVWGRDKGGPQGRGVIACDNFGIIAATYPNSWDNPWVTPVSPWTAVTMLTTCPLCITNPSASQCNQCTIAAHANPTANAGSNSNQPINTLFHLNGTASTAASGWGIQTYLWSHVGGPNQNTNLPAFSLSPITNTIGGVDTFSLTVTDNAWQTGTATVMITNGNDTIPYLFPSLGSLITLPTSSATISVVAVPHNGATISTYSWAKTSGPSTFTITSPTAASTTVTGLVAGIYVFTVTVTDSYSETNTATVAVVVHAASGTQYTWYFAAAGSDANACTFAAPCQTMTKANSIVTSLVAGDSLLFNRGDAFSGQLFLNSSSGFYGVPVWVGGYGSGVKPLITGLTTLSGWTQEGSSNIYEAKCSGCKSTLSMVLIDGTQAQLARTPNSGFLTYNTTSQDTLFTSAGLTGTPNYTGAFAVIRAGNFTFLTDSITQHNGDSVHYTGTKSPAIVNGYGFFFQKSHLALDTAREWYFNSVTDSLEVYMPGGMVSHTVQASTVDSLIYVPLQKQYIAIDSLNITGSNIWGLAFSGFFAGGGNLVSGCSFNYNGGEAIQNTSTGSALPVLTVQYCNFNHTNNIAIYSQGTLFGDLFKYDTIENTGTVPGAGGNSTAAYSAMYCTSTNAVYHHLKIDTCGYNGIDFVGDSSILRHNAISYTNYWLDDGGAIYTFRGNLAVRVQQFIDSNVIFNIPGANFGRVKGGTNLGMGIYLDQGSSQITLRGNTVSGCVGGAINLSEPNNTVVNQNTLYSVPGDSSLINIFDHSGTIPVTGLNITENIMGTQSPNMDFIHIFTGQSTISQLGFIDSNYYSSSAPLFSVALNSSVTPTIYNLSGWRGVFATDAHSISLANPNYFASNPTVTPMILPLNGLFKDVFNTTFNSIYTLPSFSGKMLFLGQSIFKVGSFPVGVKYILH